VLRTVTRDEGWHIDWVRKKAREIAERDGDPARFDRAVAHFRAIDREVWAELEEVERGWLGAS
jgi:hypothetical protein